MKRVVPDLLVLGYQLPGINGLELADRLHMSEALKHTPILATSANFPKQELEKRQILFIHKPLEAEELLQAIEQPLAP